MILWCPHAWRCFIPPKEERALPIVYRFKQNDFISSSGLGWASASMNDIVRSDMERASHFWYKVRRASIVCTTNFNISKFSTGSRVANAVLTLIEVSVILVRISDLLSRSRTVRHFLSIVSQTAQNLKRDWNSQVPELLRLPSKKYGWFGRKRRPRCDHLSPTNI